MTTHAHTSAPLRITFLGDTADQRLHETAFEEFQSLERLYGCPAYSHLIIRMGAARACQVSLHLSFPDDIDVNVDVPEHPDQWSDDPRSAIVNAFHQARGAIAEQLGHGRKRAHRDRPGQRAKTLITG